MASMRKGKSFNETTSVQRKPQYIRTLSAILVSLCTLNIIYKLKNLRKRPFFIPLENSWKVIDTDTKINSKIRSIKCSFHYNYLRSHTVHIEPTFPHKNIWSVVSFNHTLHWSLASVQSIGFQSSLPNKTLFPWCLPLLPVEDLL